MIRAVLSVALCLGTIGAGLLATRMASGNRERGARLDEKQRWCETYSRQNEELRVHILAEEWKLLSSGSVSSLPGEEPDTPPTYEAER